MGGKRLLTQCLSVRRACGGGRSNGAHRRCMQSGSQNLWLCTEHRVRWQRARRAGTGWHGNCSDIRTCRGRGLNGGVWFITKLTCLPSDPTASCRPLEMMSQTYHNDHQLVG